MGFLNHKHNDVWVNYLHLQSASVGKYFDTRIELRAERFSGE